MATATTAVTTPNSLNVTYRSVLEGGPGENRNPAITPLLELSLNQTHAQGAYLYRLNREEGQLDLAFWRGLQPSAIGLFEAQLTGATARWYFDLGAPTVIEREAWLDWRFHSFPEFIQNRFEAVVSVPLIDSGRLAGLANFARRAAGPLVPRDVTFLRSLSLPLGALLAASGARVRLETEVEHLAQQLADRKILERAKGILQARNSWSEEEAYLHLRRSSRRRRVAMREVAREVIDGSRSQSVEEAAGRVA
jgi:hypothetical protein